MGEENSNPDIIRKVNKELSDIRKERRIVRILGGVLLCACLLFPVVILWLFEVSIKQSVPAETAFQYPMPAMPAEEDSSIWIADDVSDSMSSTDDADYMDYTDYTDNMDNMDETDNTDNMDDTNNVDDTDNTDDTNEYPTQTEYPSTSVPAVVPATVPAIVSPASPRPIAPRPTAARTVKTAVQPVRKKTVTSIPTHIITRPEMTLRSLARLYYGSEVFWVYIYDRNIRVLSSLDTLPSGIELELPRPSVYGIDATEPISLQRACNLAKSLSKQ